MTRPKIWYPVYHSYDWHNCPKDNFWKVFYSGLIDNDEKVASSLNNTPNSRPMYKNYTLFKTKMAKIDILFMTKMAETLPSVVY